jgi:hypothetical protein
VMKSRNFALHQGNKDWLKQPAKVRGEMTAPLCVGLAFVLK